MAQYPKFCPNCGTPIDEGYAFCATCGAPIAMLESEEDTDSAFALTPDAVNAVLNATKASEAAPSDAQAATRVMSPGAPDNAATVVMASAQAAPDAQTQVIAPGQVEAAAPHFNADVSSGATDRSFESAAQNGSQILPNSSEQATQFMPSSQPTTQMPSEHPQRPTEVMGSARAGQPGAEAYYGMPTPPGMGYQPPGGTAPLSPVEAAQSPSAQPVSYVQSSAVPRGSDGKRKLLIALVAILAVIAIVLVLFAVSTVFGGKDEPARQSTPTQQSTDGSAKSNSSDNKPAPATEEDESSSSDREIYEALVEYYDALAEYDKSIGSVASAFNNNWTKSDLSTRQAKEMECDEVYTNLMADISDLQALNVPSTSDYADDYAAIVNLYSDCEHRISVISQAWGIANSYSDPSAHEDEVLAPIAADNVGGKNKYKKDFDDNYSSAKPHAPSA